VAANMRGRGLARSMLHELLRRDAHGEWRYLETTVTPSNEPSRRLFHALAADLDSPVAESVLFAEHDFNGEPHESEILIRIGPINGRQTERRAHR
jgi:L-2,4-diaminobutyric acid acetyltransferase